MVENYHGISASRVVVLCLHVIH